MSTLTGLLIVDQDVQPLNNNEAYILSGDGLWRTANLQTTPPTWTEVLTSADYPDDMTELTFCRVRCRGKVYVIGTAMVTQLGTRNAVCFYSSDGVSWNWSIVGEVDDPEGQFTLGSIVGSYSGLSVAFAGSGNGINFTLNISSHPPYPWSKQHVFLDFDEPLPYSAHLTLEYDVTGDVDMSGSIPPYFYYLTYLPVVTGSFSGSPGAYHFTGEIDSTRLPDLSTIDVGWHDDRAVGGPAWWNGVRNIQLSNLEIGGVFYGMMPTIAFDIGRHDSNKVYVSAKEKIYRSTDGGQHWEIYIDEIGANDIECHYAQASDDEITFWDTNGKLVRTSGGAVTGEYGGVADVSPVQVPFRVASDPVNGMPIFVLQHEGGNSYKVRKTVDGVNWTDLVTGVSVARSLKSYAIAPSMVRRYVYLSSGKIWLSTDETTFVDKTGDYALSGTPVVINLY